MSEIIRRDLNILPYMKVVIIGLLTTLLMSSPVFAQSLSSAQAESFTKELVVDLGNIAKNSSLNESSRETAYRAALQRRLATDSIGAFLFKSVPEGLATDAQIQTYDELFPSYIAAAFATQIGGLAERQINVTQSRARGAGEVIVRSELVNSAGVKKASIDWRIREVNGQPRLLDVLVERVSPLVTKRQEFASLAKRQGVEALLEHMRKVAN